MTKQVLRTAAVVLTTWLADWGAGAAAAKHKPPIEAPIPTSTGSALPTSRPPVMPYGSYCFTPLGRIGPVAAMPVGSPCSGASAQGPIAGQTVQ